MIDLKSIRETDAELYESMVKELDRQKHNLELIASENIVSEAVLAAAGTFYTNKYAEGYPSKRYYGGCQFSHHGIHFVFDGERCQQNDVCRQKAGNKRKNYKDLPLLSE